MDQIREALEGMTEVLQQQMEANIQRRQPLDPFVLLEKSFKLKPPKFKGRPDPVEKLFEAMQCPENDKVRFATFTFEKVRRGVCNDPKNLIKILKEYSEIFLSYMKCILISLLQVDCAAKVG